VSGTISFARGAPAPEALSADLVARCTVAALEADGARILSYGTGHGYPPLREWLAAQHGVPAERVIVTNGSLQGFVFALDGLLERGDLVAVEAPTYDRALLQLRLHDMAVLPIPVEADGMDVDALGRACAEGRVPKLVYTIPNFQNPSGATLSLEKRTALLALAERYGFGILEDDPYGRLRFEGERIPGLFELGGPDRVMFTSSFSKTVAPGLRIGYIVLPPEREAVLAALASRTYISPALLAQGAVHRICADGHLEGNIRRVTDLMRERRDAMVEGLHHMPPGTACTPPQGGFFLWLQLPPGLSADALFAPAEAAGVLYVKGSDCLLAGGERALRLAYSGVSPAEIAEGMRRLGAVFGEAAARAA
jgi:DNA-binding transcriptional MocR family regulator